ncbi:MAG: hypothetical protein VW362_08060, partial [Candidatus Nanopelagicales bacterium]
PGPWEAIRNHDGSESVVLGRDGQLVGFIKYVEDAALIARAPEMANWLRRIKEVCEEGRMDEEHAMGRLMAIEAIARAALGETE